MRFLSDKGFLHALFLLLPVLALVFAVSYIMEDILLRNTRVLTQILCCESAVEMLVYRAAHPYVNREGFKV